MADYYFIGIKGAGMSSLACLLADLGHAVEGSDVTDYFFTEDKLRERKIPIYPFNSENIKKGSAVIVGNAFINKNAEHETAKELGCEIYTYYEFLGLLSRKFFSIAVSGSHGKTTTTNLIRQVLEAEEPVNYLIGDGEGGGSGQSNIFVFEACEYERHFLAAAPDIAVITNIDFDHPDYYRDIYDVQDAFNTFIGQSKLIIYNGDDSLLRGIIPSEKRSISYGLGKENDYYAENISNDQVFTRFDMYSGGKYLCQLSVPLFGIHSVYNTLACAACVLAVTNDLNIIKTQLPKFRPGKRRFEETVHTNQIVVSDYAHHPREIKAIIDAVKSKYPYKKIIVYFQPHTFTRTIAFLHDFANSLKLADKVYLREIFSSAREMEKTVSVSDLSVLIDNSEIINDNRYLDTFAAYKDCVIIFMGAGDIDRYCESYRKSMQK